MPNSRGFFQFVLLLILGWMTPVAMADEPDAGENPDKAKVNVLPSSRRAEMLRLYKKGETAFVEGNYEEAINFFGQANAIRPLGRLYYNIGLAYLRMGKLADAIVAFENVPAFTIDPTLKRDAEQQIEDIKASIAFKLPPTPTPQPLAAEAARVVASTTPSPPAVAPQRHHWWGVAPTVGVAVASGVALAAGIALIANSFNIRNALVAEGAEATPANMARLSGGRFDYTVGTVLTIVGGGILVVDAGLAVYPYFLRKK